MPAIATKQPLVVDLCSKESFVPLPDFTGSYNHQLEQWEGLADRVVTAGTSGAETYTYSATSSDPKGDPDEDDINKVSDV